jgi:hypothetical protein
MSRGLLLFDRLFLFCNDSEYCSICYFSGENAPTSYRSTYRILVGIWIIFDLYWFAGVIYSISNFFNFREEIQKPLDVAIEEENAKDAKGRTKV